MSPQKQQLSVAHSLKQKQVLTPKFIQSIRLMAMPFAELHETIHEELEKNPALEIHREAPSSEISQTLESRHTEESQETNPFENSSDPGYQRQFQGDPNSKQRFIEGHFFREQSLQDRLLEQLHLLDLAPNRRKLAERLIGNLDEDGFHREDPALFNQEIPAQILQEVLDIIRVLDPLGCACVDWRESLLVQADFLKNAPPNFDIFVRKALLLMEKKRPEAVRKTLNLSSKNWEVLEHYIRSLSPFPGRRYSLTIAPYIIPDLMLRKKEGELILLLNDEILPVLQIDPVFEKIKESNCDKTTHRFISQHAQAARYFINSLTQRENTLLKTTQAIVQFQHAFFLEGDLNLLKPLKLNDIAEEIGMHEATVSRITANKYIQTEWGIFALKYFFTHAVSFSPSLGSPVSKIAVKEILREILSEIKPNQRLSDQKITVLLEKRGITLARRTVAKYRKELDLPSSHRR